MKVRLKLIPTVLALIFLLNVFSLGATADVKYNAHDVEKFRAFLEETDANGVTNGSKINALYDPDDPSTWNREDQGCSYKLGVNWNEDGRAVAFSCDYGVRAVVYGDFDVSGCDALEYVIAYGAAFESMNFDGCTSLSRLMMYSPEVPLEQIDLSTNTALTKIVLNNNALTELDLSGNPNLTQISVEYNELSKLHLSGNSNLTQLSAKDNKLTELDLSGSPNLTYLSVDDNKLTELDVSNNMKLMTISCERNSIKDIDLTGLSELIELRCNYNELTAIDMSQCPELRHLQFNRNNIESIDLSQNLKLVTLDCAGNSLTELNVSGLTELWEIECQSNELTSLDLRDTSINVLFCSGNKLQQILFPENFNLLRLYCQNNRLSSLDFEYIPKLYSFNGDGNLFEELLFSSKVTEFSCLGNPMRHLSLWHDSGSVELFAQGNGAIGAFYDYDIMKYMARAEANDGETFLGWYDESGNLVSEEADYALDSTDCILYARFSESVPTSTPSADPTQAPVDQDPDNPTPPITGAISLICIGLAVAAGGATAVFFHRKGRR